MGIEYKNNLPDKYFYFPVMGLALCLILKIIQTGIRLYEFPFSPVMDINNHMLNLFFLKEYGFHHQVIDAYHYIITFKEYPPGWGYFSLPFYSITENLIISLFLSLLAILCLGFLFIYFFNKNITPIKRIAFFFFLFANLQMIDYLQIGRYPEMLGWVIFIPLFYYAILYKKRKIDLNFFLIISLLFSTLILTHIYVATVSSVIIISLFFIKSHKEKLMIFLTVLTSFALTSFWWVPFLNFVKSLDIKINNVTELLNRGSIISYNTFFILALFFITFFYLKQGKDKQNNKDVLFLIPSLVLGFLMVTRLIVFIPVFNKVPVTPYNIYFLFLTVYLFFQTDFKVKNIKKIVLLFLILLTLGSLSIFYSRITPFIPPKDELQMEIISFFPIIQDNFFIFNFGNTSYTFLVPYAKIYYNLSSPARLHNNIINEDVELKSIFKNEDCQKLKLLIQDLHLKNLVSYDQGCDVLRRCNFNEKLLKERACFYYFREY